MAIQINENQHIYFIYRQSPLLGIPLDGVSVSLCDQY